MKKKYISPLICMLIILAIFSPVGMTTKNKNDYGPTVEITSPSDNYETTESSIIVKGNITTLEAPIKEYGYSIYYPGGGTFSEFWTFDNPKESYEFSIEVNIVEGEEGNFITVFAKDTMDNEGSDSITVYLITGDDTIPPEVTITYPENEMIIIEPYITVSGYGTDNVGVTSMRVIHEWLDNQEDSGPIPFSPPSQEVSFEYPLILREGWNRITVWLYDAELNKGNDVVEVNCETECTDKKPRIADWTFGTDFYGLFIGCDYTGQSNELDGAENSAKAMYNALKDQPGWDESRMRKLLGDQVTSQNIENMIDSFKDHPDQGPPNPGPGDEFVLFFAGHGYNISEGRPPIDEEDGMDEGINCYNEGDVIVDDDLRRIISDFPECVTINIKLDCCHAGGFKDGAYDLPAAKDANRNRYSEEDKLAIEPACEADEEIDEIAYFWEDKDHDGVATPDEYVCELKRNETPPAFWFIDKDGDGLYMPGVDEVVPENSPNISYMTNFSYANLEGLKLIQIMEGLFTTQADRNQDLITTLRELAGHSNDLLICAFSGDNDGDGLTDEDDGEYLTVDIYKTKIYIDNDGDGKINEDRAFKRVDFWPNNPPDKPSKPSGETNGKTGESYTYSTSTNDPDLGEEIWYLFDWGDGTNSGWLGPYEPEEICSEQHSWTEKGDYKIEVKARDMMYAESEWSDPLSISMPKNKVKTIDIPFFKFLENYPLIYKIIQKIGQTIELSFS